MDVQVVFEHQEDPNGDIWLPLFEPAATAERSPMPEQPVEQRCAISGVGQSAIGRRLGIDPLELTLDACLAAVDDAGLTLADIDGVSTYPGMMSAPRGFPGPAPSTSSTPCASTPTGTTAGPRPPASSARS